MQKHTHQSLHMDVRVHNARIKGFTLVELMITIGIFAILASMAVPSFNGLIETQRAKTTSTDIFLALTKTRSEAVKRNTNVTVSPIGGNWSNGWQILNPSDGSVLDTHGATSGVSITGPASVVFRGSGRVQGATSTFAIASTGATAVARCVTIDSSGRPYAKAAAC